MPLRDPHHGQPNRQGDTQSEQTLPHSPQSQSDLPLALDHERLFWPRIPGYQITAELGSGGAAVVYLARHSSLNRLIALKVLLGGALATTLDRERFRREAEAAAKLDHPNVIQVYDIGEHNGALYLSLEYASGSSLDRTLKRQPLSPIDAAYLVERIAGGIEAAHAAGILHRDLKPANILLAADGQPKIADFGLARQIDQAYRLTQSGMSAGTPSYMAPEQVLPEVDQIGVRTDVYGLGAILYECLTARPPFAAPTSLETMRQVAEAEVVSIRSLQWGVPRDLETICRKCLEKEPQKRYPTARALAADLARFRSGAPILARRMSPVEHAWQWARRHPVIPLLVLTLGMMTVSVAALMAWTTYHAYQVASHLRDRELRLHGLRGSLLQLDESQARHTDLAATTGDPTWANGYRTVKGEAERQRADASQLAPEETASAELLQTADKVATREQHALELVRNGRANEAWQYLRSDEHRCARNEYAAAVDQFGDRVDLAADAELRQIQTEGFWSLVSATAVAGLIGVTAVTAWIIYLRRSHHRLRNASPTR